MGSFLALSVCTQGNSSRSDRMSCLLTSAISPVLSACLTSNLLITKVTYLFTSSNISVRYLAEPLLLYRSPSSMCTLWTLLLNLSIPDVPFPVLSSTFFQYYHQLSSGADFRPNLQPSWSLMIFPFLFAVEKLYGTWYQSGSFSLINVGSGFHCLRSFFFSLSVQEWIKNLYTGSWK